MRLIFSNIPNEKATKAAVMQGQIPEQIKAKRSARLIELGEKNRRAYEESFLGKTVEVLVEEKSDVKRKRNVDRAHKKSI